MAMGNGGVLQERTLAGASQPLPADIVHGT